MPAISLILSYPDNPFLSRRFPTRLAAIRAAEQFQDWVNHNLFWLAECILRSRIHGPSSSWYFGRLLGLSNEEFHRRMSTTNSSPVADHVLYRVEGNFYFTALDFEIAHLIRPWFTHLGVSPCFS
jgi:hypothetical protein